MRLPHLAAMVWKFALKLDQTKSKLKCAGVPFCSGNKVNASSFMSPPSSLWKADQVWSLLIQVLILLSTLFTFSKSEFLQTLPATTTMSSSNCHLSPSLLLLCCLAGCTVGKTNSHSFSLGFFGPLALVATLGTQPILAGWSLVPIMEPIRTCRALLMVHIVCSPHHYSSESSFHLAASHNA